MVVSGWKIFTQMKKILITDLYIKKQANSSVVVECIIMKI